MQAQAIKVALITDFATASDRDSIAAVLQGTEIDLEGISAADFSATSKDYNVLWIHGNQMSPMNPTFSQAIAHYVQNGGRVFLTMDALRMLNTSKIETNPIEMRPDKVVDSGYGRLRGFHAFKQHPVFEQMHGGAYVSKMRSDYTTTMWGFFDEHKPKEGKVVGIQWTYITFHEENKLILEYDYGSGKILACGAYIDFAERNSNRIYLKQFLQNSLLYLTHPESFTPGQYWKYRPFTAIKSEVVEPRMPIQSIEMGVTHGGNPSLRLYTDKDEEYDLTGKQILWSGQLQGDLKEVWIPPFMPVHDVKIGYVQGDTVKWLSDVAAQSMVSPVKIVKEYSASGLVETHTVLNDEPAGRVSLLNKNNDDKEIVVRFHSNMRLMWPYSEAAAGGLRYDYLQGLGSYVISTENSDEKAVINFSFRPSSEKISVDEEKRDLIIENRFLVKPKTTLNITIAGGTKPLDSLLYICREYYQLDRMEMLHPSNKRELIAVTSDSLMDVGLKWAIAKTKQFFQTTPGVGTSLVAGYSNTSRGWDGGQKVSGRPGYAWYFGRDAVWSSFALLDIGDFEGVMEVMEMLRKYQNLDGKIFHELTTSGVAHYDAADATPLYLILAGKYLRYSGDTTYIRTILPSLQKALSYCLSTDTDGDGLIENTNVGHGWIEGGKLFGSHTELYLAGCWAAALDEMAYICTHTGNQAQGAKLLKRAAAVRKSINEDFWDPKNQTFSTGKFRNGTYLKYPTVLMAVPAYFGNYSDEKGQQALSSLAGRGFTSDWGLRMISDSSRLYNPEGYHEGMVWPLFTGWASLGEYATGHFWAGFYHWRSNLLLFDKTSPGGIEETYNGEKFKPQGVCPVQCWSEAMAIQPLVEGTLGYKPDALSNTFSLSPAIPWDWEKANYYFLRMGDNFLSMRYNRLAHNTTVELYAEKPAKVHFEPILPLGSHIGRLLVDSIPQPFSVEYLPGGIKLIPDSTFMINSNLKIQIKHFDGIGVLPPEHAALKEGSSSGQFSLISEQYKDMDYTFVIEGTPGTEYKVSVFIGGNYDSIEGATFFSRVGQTINMKVKIPESKEKYARKTVTVHL